MAIERTLSIIKPDAVAKNVIGQIYSRFESAGLKIVAARQLSAAQQDTVNQIESYVKQSKQASDDGDLQRAYTLANKARMLSGDLVKH